MQSGDDRQAFDILEHVAMSNIFATQKYVLPLQLAILSSAMRLKDYDTLLSTSRQLMRTAQFRSEPFQFFTAVLGSGLRAVDTFGNLNLQKFLLRELRAWDVAADGKDINWNDRLAKWIVPGKKKKMSDREVSRNINEEEYEDEDEDQENRNSPDEAESESDDEDDQDQIDHAAGLTAASGVEKIYIRHDPWPKPTKRSAILYAVYGQVMLVAKSDQSAICESFRFIHCLLHIPWNILTELG